MAYIEGTLEDIYTYLGPRTSDIVTQLARPYRKEKGIRKSCGELNNDGTKCKQYTGLHAAHLKGRERKVLIREILDEFGKKTTEKTYKIELKKFEEEFKKKHENFHDVIKFMCPSHHKNYDLLNGIFNSEEEPIVDIEEFEDIIEISKIIEDYNSLNYLLNNKEFILKALDSLKFKRNLNEIILILTDSKECKQLFKLNYPLLISTKNIEQDLYRRYYSYEIFTDHNGNEYKITNHWFKPQREAFEYWFDQNK